MNSKLEIRQATKSDLPLVFSFVKGLADHVNLSSEVTATEEDLQKYIFEENSFVEVLIGSYEKIPVAFLIYYPSFSTFIGKPGIHIEDFYIKPDFRGKGIGKAFFKHLTGLALGRDCGKIEWYAGEWNENALGFYKTMGAQKLDGRIVLRLTGDAMQNLVNH